MELYKKKKISHFKYCNLLNSSIRKNKNKNKNKKGTFQLNQ